jgi:hypothetical protein
MVRTDPGTVLPHLINREIEIFPAHFIAFADIIAGYGRRFRAFRGKSRDFSR